jgi:hypothetical protein
LHVSRAPEKQDGEARTLIARAEQKFGDRQFPEARLLFEQANQADQTLALTQECRERWAYCKLYHVVEQLNQNGGRPPLSELEQEVNTALQLAPRLDYGKSLLTEIQKRRDTGANPEVGKSDRSLPIKHNPQNADGWFVAETANFRIFHKQTEDLAEKVAQVAERTRLSMLRKWFGNADETWTPRCDLYLHATAQDYGKVTGYYNSPGHSSLKMENGRLVLRRIDLHCDDLNMLTAILPHETTHVVLAGQFGEQLVPRWADEGMAVLAEPKEKQDRHRKNLVQGYQDGVLFHVPTLFQMEHYPHTPRDVSAFYAQSLSFVEFLANRRGPQEFSLFLLDGMRYGYEKSLQRHYEFKSYADMEQQWIRETLLERREGTGVAQR